MLREMNEFRDEQEELETLKRKVLVHVGVSLARYQKIERGLKALLPFLAVDDREPPTDPYVTMGELLESKSALGPLMEQLKEYTSSSDPEETALYLETIVHYRNELVHHFFQLPHFSFLSENTHHGLAHLGFACII